MLNVNKEAEKKEFKQAGISDDSILCEECERLFTPFDTHGFEVIMDALESKQIYKDRFGKECAYIAQKADYQLFKLFILSVLWRASVSSHFFFTHIKLGAHEERIRKMIQSKDAGMDDDYSILCFHLLGQHYSRTILPPYRHKIEGINYCRFYLPDMMFLIKVDSRPSPQVARVISIKPNAPLYFAFQNYFGSAEMRFMEETKVLLKKHAGIPSDSTYRYEKPKF